MLLDEVKPGMRGEWVTVVGNGGRESFPFEVVAIARNQRGPGEHAILARAIDPHNRAIGPVAGMSGSPCYIEGRLIGAYSFGYTWQKGDSSIFGITPIENMGSVLLDMPQNLPPRQQLSGTPFPAAQRPSSPETQLAPIHLAGFSPSVLQLFAEEIAREGLQASGQLLSSAAFSADARSDGNNTTTTPREIPSHATEDGLQAGDALAAVLMQGDFSAAAIGTITYRSDNQLLAFGHPFRNLGHTAIPLAPAEVFTMVDAFPVSFKLGRAGRPAGAIVQDRLTAVSGVIGASPHTTAVHIRLFEDSPLPNQPSSPKVQEFQAQVFEHPRLGPLFTAMALAQTLLNTIDSSEEMTLHLSGTVHSPDLPPISFRQTATGASGPGEMAREFLENYRELLFNPHGMPQIDRVDLEVRREARWRQGRLTEAWVENARLRPGGTLQLALRITRFQEKDSVLREQIPLPAFLQPGETIEVWIGSGRNTDNREGVRDLRPASLQEIARRWSATRPNNAIYIQLLRRQSGLQTATGSLPALPPGIRDLFADAAWALPQNQLDTLVLWEKVIPQATEFIGQSRLLYQIEP